VHIFALSITHFFSSAGADAGFAALVGLAILVLLYFAHARETSTLRDQLETAMRRIEQLERGGAPSVGTRQTVGGETSSARPVTAPPPSATGSEPPPPSAGASAPPPVAPPPSVAPEASAPPPVAPPPSLAATVSARRLSARPVVAPAGWGAPPLSDATRVVPVAQPPGDGEAAASVPGERAAVAGDGLATTPASVTGTTPAPVTAAARGNGFSAAPAADEAAGRSGSLLHGLPGGGKVPRWLIPVAAVVLVAAIAVLLVLVLRPGSSDHKTAAAAQRRHTADIAVAPPSVAPSLVTVAVVNATGINDLAHHVSTKLTAMRFQPGTLATATNQSHSTTTVGYLAGHRNDALAVAHALRLPAGAVRLAPQSTEGLVCPNPSDCTADVIVVAGSNLAHKR
jgi:LytR cell envelope-related transcriptional attenuator